MKIFDNIMRFFRKKPTEMKHLNSAFDNYNDLNARVENTAPIIEKWYKKIGFPNEYDKAFYKALDEIEIGDYYNIDTYDLRCEDGKKNLLAFLYFCEETSEKYKQLGINEELLIDNLQDIATWTRIWSEAKGELYLGELEWLRHHLSVKLFKIGRLQYCFEKSGISDAHHGIEAGDNIISIHIPEGKNLNIDDCKQSIKQAKMFFARYFPDYEYKYFMCHSWFLGTAKNILKPESNIIKFADLFDIVKTEESDLLLKYIFGLNASRDNIYYFEPKSSLGAEVKRMALNGERFYDGYGVIENI